MKKLTIAFVLTLAAVAAAVATSAASASTGAAPTLASIPVTGTTSAGGSFVGTAAVTNVTREAGTLVATGTLSGTIVNAAGVPTGTVDAVPFAAPVQQAQQTSCTLFSFSIGPIDVNVAGLVTVHVEPIAVSVTLNGILGTLLCGILGGGTPPAPAPVPA